MKKRQIDIFVFWPRERKRLNNTFRTKDDLRVYVNARVRLRTHTCPRARARPHVLKAGAKFNSPGMKAICLIEKSGISRELKLIVLRRQTWKWQTVSNSSPDYVCLQTKGRLFDSNAPDHSLKRRQSPAWVLQLTSSCYFHVQQALAHCHAWPWQGNCCLALNVCRETGHFPCFAQIEIPRRRGASLEADQGIVTSATHYLISCSESVRSIHLLTVPELLS